MPRITRTRATPSINSSSPSPERPVSPNRLSPDWQPRYSQRLESQQDLDFYKETSSDSEADRRSQSQSNSNSGGYASSSVTAVEDEDQSNSSGQPSSAKDGAQLTRAWSTQSRSRRIQRSISFLGSFSECHVQRTKTAAEASGA